MSVSILKNRFKTLNSQLENNQISLVDAQEKAVLLLAEALDLQKNAELTSDEQFKLANLIDIIEELANSNTNEASC